MTKKITAYLLATCLLTGILIVGCSDSDSGSSNLIVNRFYPTSGGVGTEILITGENFTSDKSQVSVTIDGTPLHLLDCNSTGIMVVVPKKTPSGPLMIKIGDREGTSVENFTYEFVARVTTLAGTGIAGYMDGDVADAQFAFVDDAKPWRKGSLCVDNQGNVYIGDAANFCLRKITPEGKVSTLAGKRGGDDYVDGEGEAARFRDLYGMDCDAQGNIYISDVTEWAIRKVTPEGVVSTFLRTPFDPWGLAVDRRNGTLYISNPEGGNSGIWQIKPDGTVTHIVKNIAIGGVTVDKDGNLFATEFRTHLVVKFDADTWNRTLIAGSEKGYEDGSSTNAKFSEPWGITIDADGELYIAGNGTWDGGDNADQSVRVVNVQKGVVKTVAGSENAGFQDANGKSASFRGALDVAVDSHGIIYVYDRKNNAIRKIVYE